MLADSGPLLELQLDGQWVDLGHELGATSVLRAPMLDVPWVYLAPTSDGLLAGSGP
jgi:hypothetical protein